VTTILLRWLPVVSAGLQLVGSGLIVWGLKVVSMPRGLTLVRDPTPEEIAANKKPPATTAAAGIVREHGWAVTLGVVLLLIGLALAVVMAFPQGVTVLLKAGPWVVDLHDFAINFFANLGGALFGVLLAFGIDRRKAQRDADRLYGHMLLSARSELNYLQPMCASLRDQIKAGETVYREPFNIPATAAVLVSPLTHERAPYSLVMALTAVKSYAATAADSLGESLRKTEPFLARREQPEVAAALHGLTQALAGTMDRLHDLIAIAEEGITTELERLGLSGRQPDPATAVVSRRLLAVLQRKA
jgi:hypothetical protein